MKFTSPLPHQHLDLLNLRVQIRDKGCQHCHCQGSLKSHGYLYGLAASSNEQVTRGLRFFAPTATPMQAVDAPSPSTGIAYYPAVCYDHDNSSSCCSPSPTV